MYNDEYAELEEENNDLQDDLDDAKIELCILKEQVKELMHEIVAKDLIIQDLRNRIADLECEMI